MEISSEILETYFTEVHFKKDEFLTEIGSVEKWLYYIDEGIIRFFYYNPTTQKETTVDIAIQATFVCLMLRLSNRSRLCSLCKR